MSTIPASIDVNVTPSVISAGGSALDLNGLFLTTSARVPIGTVQSFASADEVESFFGGTSQEAVKAAVYFAGFDNSDVKPGAMLLAQYPLAAVPAYLRSGDLSGLTLAQLQAIGGFLSVTIDGVVKSGNVDLSGATSFSAAAQLIQTTLNLQGLQQGQVTATIAGQVMTVTAVESGTVQVGQEITGAGIAAGTMVSSFGTGTGSVGTYNLSAANAVANAEADQSARAGRHIRQPLRRVHDLLGRGGPRLEHQLRFWRCGGFAAAHATQRRGAVAWCRCGDARTVHGRRHDANPKLGHVPDHF
jgi:hypothetical protein